MAFDRSKFIARFIEEARDHVENINNTVVALEKDPDNEETINSLFRSAHTIKGSSRMMKMGAISDVAHKIEDIFSALRDANITVSKGLIDIILKGVDAISGLLDDVSSDRQIIEAPEDICKALEMAAKGNIIEQGPENMEQPEKELLGKEQAGDSSPRRAEPGTVEGHAGDEPVSVEAAGQAEKPSDMPAGKDEAKPMEKLPEPDEPHRRKDDYVPGETIRIRAEKLDDLIKQMGEIVSAGSRLEQRIVSTREIERSSRHIMKLLDGIKDNIYTVGAEKDDLLQSAGALNLSIKTFADGFREDFNIQKRLTSELQDISLSLRMYPLAAVFSSLPRTVRDIATSFGKDIDFVMTGEETELDKKIIEKIGESIIHMLRNSIDHGIESPEERLRAGKPEKGTIRLAAGYEKGTCLIELSDDGAGIDISRLKEKAISKNILDASQADAMPVSEAANLIFHPGLSTSRIITDISGRGVGLDVVKKNIIDELGGSIQIVTNKAQGTTFYIRLPLSMAIVHVMLVSVSRTVFAVPANVIAEIIQIKPADIIDVVDKKAIRLREQIMPVVDLADILGLPGENRDDDKGLLILVVSVGTQRLGVIVDSLLDEEDRVIKSLPPHMKDIPWVSGCIISGHNEIVNVLNMHKIISSAKQLRHKRQAQDTFGREERPVQILVVDDSISTREIEKSILESYGYAVSLASDGVEGLAKAQGFKYDLVISDVEMPRMDGFTMTARLREDEEYKDTPIILVTSRDKDEDKKRGILSGADAYIVKGTFDQGNLLKTIQGLVG